MYNKKQWCWSYKAYKLIKSQANLQSVIECKNLKAKGNGTNPNYKYNYNVHNTKGTKDTD